MSAGYVPQVGDRVRLEHWGGDWIEVLHVDREFMAVRTTDDRHDWYPLVAAWVKVDKPEPWPVRHFVVTRGGGYDSLRQAVDSATMYDSQVLAILRSNADHTFTTLNPDGSVTVLDHTGAELP